MKIVYLMMADGTEECEALIAVDLLRRAGVDVRTVSINKSAEIVSSHNIRIHTDLTFDQVDFEDGEMLVLPGGMPGTKYLDEHTGLSAVIDRYASQDKWLAAICAAPSILGKKGLLSGMVATSFPSFADQLEGASYSGKPVELDSDKKIITGKGLGASIPFSLKLIEVLLDRETAEAVGDAIHYDCDY
ncbi:MAG: DJ-1 family glyoxalase III [Fastidiosipilaceae bacterium]